MPRLKRDSRAGRKRSRRLLLLLRPSRKVNGTPRAQGRSIYPGLRAASADARYIAL